MRVVFLDPKGIFVLQVPRVSAHVEQRRVCAMILRSFGLRFTAPPLKRS